MLDALEHAIARRRYRRIQPHHAGGPPDPARPVGSDCLPEIEHIVILMMENHSYDNYLGTLAGRGDGFPLDANGAPMDPHGNRDEHGVLLPPRHLASTVQKDGVPSQTWSASHIQYNDGALDGFPRSVEETVPDQKQDEAMTMGYWDETDLPFYHHLARTFPLATRWFSSCLGPTFPNRRFLVSGTAHGLIDDVAAGLLDKPPAGTIFDVLTAHRISWANYHNKPPWRTLCKSVFGRPGMRIGRHIVPYLAGILPNLEGLLGGNYQFSADTYPRGLLETYNHALSLQRFFAAAAGGTLPSFCIVDPDFRAWSEEDPQDIQRGESFAAAVINAVMAGPGWPKTLLIWTYDEHGGYYDHVPPPPAVPPDDVLGRSLPEQLSILRRLPFLEKKFAELSIADAGPRTYDRYGFRVPAVMVSPYARQDFVTDRVYDHTSVLKLVEVKWNLPALTRRDAAALAPLDTLDFQAPPAFLVPPTLTPPAQSWSL